MVAKLHRVRIASVSRVRRFKCEAFTAAFPPNTNRLVSLQGQKIRRGKQPELKASVAAFVFDPLGETLKVFFPYDSLSQCLRRPPSSQFESSQRRVPANGASLPVQRRRSRDDARGAAGGGVAAAARASLHQLLCALCSTANDHLQLCTCGTISQGLTMFRPRNKQGQSVLKQVGRWGKENSL